MTMIKHNPEKLFAPYRNYSHAIEVAGETSLLFISGLNGYLQDRTTMPDCFEEQGNIIWEYMGEILKSADMNYSNIISVRTYLANTDDWETNTQLRIKYLGDHEPSLTTISCQLLDPRWKLEVEAIATS